MHWASLILKLRERFWATLVDAAARQQANCGENVRFGHEASVLNILDDPAHIVLGANSFIRGHLQVFAHGGRIEAGEWFYLGPQSTVWSSGSGVTIGNRVLVSFGVHIHDTNSHPMNAEKRFGQTRAILTTGHPKVDP